MAETQIGQETKSEEFIQKTMEYLMGEALDLGKMSDIGDRQLTQFQKSIKNKFNEQIRIYKNKLILKEEK